MCRLFGFRSQGPSPVHHSLARAENALRHQSREHPDGWGIGWWGPGAPEPKLVRGVGAAFAEDEFLRYAQMVSSTAVIAHVRKASVGPVQLDNAHPFRWGPWLFAHNGTLRDFARAQPAIEAEIDPAFLPIVEGDTDSVRCFAIFLTRLARICDPLGNVAIEAVARALAETVKIVAAITDPGAPEPSATTFLVGNGQVMLACRRGRTLWFSTHKSRCVLRDTCPRFASRCEAPVAPGEAVNHLIVASERISLEDVWHEVPVDGMIGVDGQLKLHRFHLADWSVPKRDVA